MSIGLFILGIYIIAVVHMHYRGEVRFSAARQAITHTNYLAPYNLLVDLCSSLPSRPILDVNDIKDLHILRDHWQTIRDEALRLAADGAIKSADGKIDIGFDSFFRRGWTRFYLKWYRAPLPSAVERCPATIELLNQCPSVKAAMFACLPSGGVLKPHRDPFAGSLRYHLGLVTPNSDKCYILVDGQKHAWRDGQDVLFDETYIHEAKNDTDSYRIILFCDVSRPMRFKLMDKLNQFMGTVVIGAAATPNVVGEPIGAVNRAFEKLYSLRVLAKRFKSWNKPLYVGTKYAVLLGLVYFLFL